MPIKSYTFAHIYIAKNFKNAINRKIPALEILVSAFESKSFHALIDFSPDHVLWITFIFTKMIILSNFGITFYVSSDNTKNVGKSSNQ